MERTYVFNQDGNGGNGGSKFDIMAMLPNLMGSKGVDPGLLALLNQGRNNQDMWGGSGMWFIWIILLWFCWGGNGFGNRFGNGGGSYSGGSDMSERRMPGYFPEYPIYRERRSAQPYGEDMSERRRRRANEEFM